MISCGAEDRGRQGDGSCVLNTRRQGDGSCVLSTKESAIVMKTVVLDASEQKNIEICAGVIRSGELVALPTETVYGLGANAIDEASVAKIFEIKGRPEDNPLIVHIALIDDVKPLVMSIPDVFYNLADKYWPGPLTLIMQKSDAVPDNVTAGLDTVAIRMPSHPAALALIRTAGVPVAAPSANPSGKPSPTKASHVFNDIGGKIKYILDGGDCEVGIESTVLDISGEVPKILRPGYVTYEELNDMIGNVETAATDNNQSDKTEAPKSPGMKYRHYAPKTQLMAVTGPSEKTAEYIMKCMDADSAALMFDDFMFSHPNVISFGNSYDHAEQASRLFDALRQADSLNATIIYAQVPQEEGFGIAVANRIRKAAGSNITYQN